MSHHELQAHIAFVAEMRKGWQQQLLDRFVAGGMSQEVSPNLWRVIANRTQMLRRVHFLPRSTWSEFLNYLHIADGLPAPPPLSIAECAAVLLDPHPFGGDTSSRESLFMETPVVTLPSVQLAGRYTQAFLHRVGLTECIAKDFDEYLEIAIRIASDKEYGKTLSEKLSKTKMSLFMQKVCR